MYLSVNNLLKSDITQYNNNIVDFLIWIYNNYVHAVCIFYRY